QHQFTYLYETTRFCRLTRPSKCHRRWTDVATKDFHLFGPLKRRLAGRRFVADERTRGEVRALPVLFRNEIHVSLHLWNKCLDTLTKQVVRIFLTILVNSRS